MEYYEEKKRERRIRDYRRMFRRAERASRILHGLFEPDSHAVSFPGDWDELFAARRYVAQRWANNLKRCSCSLGCGNGRRLRGDRTLQEYRCGLAAVAGLCPRALSFEKA